MAWGVDDEPPQADTAIAAATTTATIAGTRRPALTPHLCAPEQHKRLVGALNFNRQVERETYENSERAPTRPGPVARPAIMDRVVALTVGEGSVVIGLALVLALAAAAKLAPSAPSAPSGDPWLGSDREPAARRRIRLVAAVETIAAGLALVVPTRIGALLEAGLFGAFAVEHVRTWRAGAAACDCFGPGRGATVGRGTALTAGSAILALGAALAAPPSLIALARADPVRALTAVLGAALGALAWRAAFQAGAPRTARSRLTIASEELVNRTAWLLERRMSRRTALVRLAVAGSALCVAPLRYLLYPVSAMAAITPGDCAGGLCTDGYTAFCCEIDHGLNACPTGTFPGGWWMCQDYAGGRLCAEEGVRYYVDCNRLPGVPFPGGCHCADDDCGHRRVACNVFRYGQCNPQIAGITEVVCRMVVCENPSSIPDLGCSASLALDDSVCAQDVPCLEDRARELAGAGGV